MKDKVKYISNNMALGKLVAQKQDYLFSLSQFSYVIERALSVTLVRIPILICTAIVRKFS